MDNQKTVLLNTVVEINNSIESVSAVNPLYNYMSEFLHSLDTLCSTDNVCIDQLAEALKVTADQQEMVPRTLFYRAVCLTGLPCENTASLAQLYIAFVIIMHINVQTQKI